MRLALALVLAIIATVHNAGASAQKATPDVRTLSVARRIQEGADSLCGLVGRRWNPAQRRLE